MPCREHLSQLRQAKDAWQARNVEVRVVTFDQGFILQSYIEETETTWPILIDVKKQLYSAYGLERGSWWKIAGPISILKYLKMMFSGHRPHKPGSDYQQLGGDVLVDPQGIVRYHFASADPHDRPPVNELLQAVDLALTDKNGK